MILQVPAWRHRFPSRQRVPRMPQRRPPHILPLHSCSPRSPGGNPAQTKHNKATNNCQQLRGIDTNSRTCYSLGCCYHTFHIPQSDSVMSPFPSNVLVWLHLTFRPTSLKFSTTPPAAAETMPQRQNNWSKKVEDLLGLLLSHNDFSEVINKPSDWKTLLSNPPSISDMKGFQNCVSSCFFTIVFVLLLLVLKKLLFHDLHFISQLVFLCFRLHLLSGWAPKFLCSTLSREKSLERPWQNAERWVFTLVATMVLPHNTCDD